MISPRLFDLVRCPDCRGAIEAAGPVARCSGCGRSFEMSGGYLDLRPREAFDEQTKYLDEALHADARQASIAPAVLGSKIRQDMLRRFLALGPADRAVDLGCGSGRALAWNADSGTLLMGIDISPYFAREALARHDLVRGDLRRLPLRDGVFTKAWTLDVVEHVSREALADVLAEANRVLVPGGVLFVYSHVRKNGWIAMGVRAVNRLAKALDRVGLVDLRQERLRKSDHVNPLADHDDLAAFAARAGFHIERITYYTPIVGSFVENVLVRMAERLMVRRAAAGARRGSRPADADVAAGDTGALKAARRAAKATVSARGATYRALLGLTALMKLDILLFGGIRSGPFFALLRKDR